MIFSTVGDGSTYTARGYENESPTNCFFVNYLCSLEALIGVLYSGFCGAILFGKVLRIQSHAQVTFSDPIVVRYGRGVVASDEESVELSCPVLEFRIVNRLFNEPGGEILDASLNVVANIDADDADQPLRNSCDMSSLPGGIKADLDGNSMDSSCDDEVSCTSSPSIDDVPTTGRTLPSIFGPGSLLQRKKHQMLDKDFSKRRVSKVIFSKVSALSRVLQRAWKNELIVLFLVFADENRPWQPPVVQTSLDCASYSGRIFANCKTESTENDSKTWRKLAGEAEHAQRSA